MLRLGAAHSFGFSFPGDFNAKEFSDMAYSLSRGYLEWFYAHHPRQGARQCTDSSPVNTTPTHPTRARARLAVMNAQRSVATGAGSTSTRASTPRAGHGPGAIRSGTAGQFDELA